MPIGAEKWTYSRSWFSGITSPLGYTCATTVVGVVCVAGRPTVAVIGLAPAGANVT